MRAAARVVNCWLARLHQDARSNRCRVAHRDLQETDNGVRPRGDDAKLDFRTVSWLITMVAPNFSHNSNYREHLDTFNGKLAF